MKSITPNQPPETLELATLPKEPMPVAARQPSSLDILDAAVRGGVTSENVAVVKEIIAMRREEMKEVSKAEFAKAFFRLKKAIAATNIYADKSAMNNGKVAYTYCSEREISEALEPVLFENGFAMLFSQRKDEGSVTAVITLIHEGGHQEVGEYSVRAGNTNAMKDATAADAGSTTSAWRHLVIKMFGLKSRIQEGDDPRNLGDTHTKVTAEQAGELEHRVKMVNGNVSAFLKLAGATLFSEIPASKYDELDAKLKIKEGGGK